MRVAVISDIHSNYYAFKAVVDDAISKKVDSFIFLGDYVSDLSEPVKTLDLLYDIKSKYLTYCLIGNRERYMLEYDKSKTGFCYGSKTGSLLYTYNNLRDIDLKFFRNLKIYDVIDLDGIRIEIAHASMNDDRYLFNDKTDNIKDIFDQMKTKYLLTGHSHKQYCKTYFGKTILNPGSVGVPQNKKWLSEYAILDIIDGNIFHTLCAVPYNIENTIHAQFSSGLVGCARYWAIGVLYDVITGDNWIVQLLKNVYDKKDDPDEHDWYLNAKELGMKFTEQEILAFMAKYIKSGYNEN